MRKIVLSVFISGVFAASLLAGCGDAGNSGNAGAVPAVESAVESAAVVTTSETENMETANSGETMISDQEAADKVAALIDAIYVQEWSEDTEDQCAEAKVAWDALTDAQKEMVSGEFADPDYFGLDTGDASKDDPLNADGIGGNELLVVSFGTSFNDSRAEDIGSVEKALASAYPDWDVRRAFTSQIIINHVLARDGEQIDNVEQALTRAQKNGVKNLIVQPTHLMHGAEYDELSEAVSKHEDEFEDIVIAEPLLGEAVSDAKTVNDDKKSVAESVTAEALKEAGYADPGAAGDAGVAFIFLGHGTSHVANVTYDQMQNTFKELGYKNVFVGTVEGEPEDTECSVVIDRIREAGYSKVILRPMMVVAGDHANNDMAGEDEDSWKSMVGAAEGIEGVECQIEGLGRIPEVQKLYAAHTGDALKNMDDAALTVDSKDSAGAGSASGASGKADTGESASGASDPSGKSGNAGSQAGLVDGVYTCNFNTDSSMFAVCEACDGKGLLTVKNGEMTIHISLMSEKIVNLFPGVKEDAGKSGAELLEPVKDT
ncbi:MAG: sirohydrochlorin cobaltochelatase, partial [Lachnospiraceae bacterium]|nr:sirohydrochlorin cobaltochelatase [Lachnospiraceae bacterium]